MPVEEQMRVLMRGVEYGDPHIRATMEHDLRERLAEGRPLRVYCGFDPTSTDLTIGNLVPMLKMRQFQRLGHEVVFLIGTMTGIVGDPSDKTAARQMLTMEQVNANAETWISQAFRVLDPRKTIVKRNGAWLADLTLSDVVELGSHFTVAQFLERETFRNRLAEGKPIYVHEFLYALMQAYDAYVLETDVQIGGVDQLFNIMAGRTLQRDLGKPPLVAVCTPLLIGTDGHLKMSKSTGNYIGMDDPPADMYGKVMSIPDSLVVNYFTLLTEVDNDEIAAIERGIEARTLNPMEQKKRLAREIVSLLWGADAAAQAQSEFERVFQRREQPVDHALEIAWKDLPFAHGLAGPGAEISLPHLVARVTGISVSEGRRLVSQGAIEVDGVPVSANTVQVAPGTTIRAGRHRFIRITSEGLP
jgi:tyrosyl-tRNA synthetase